MEVPYIESNATSLQAEAIADRLSRCGVENRIIYNPYEEAVAVHVPKVLSARLALGYTYRSMGYAPILEENMDYNQGFIQQRLAHTRSASRLKPYGLQSGQVYPSAVESVIDCAVFAATDGTQLGTDLVAYEAGGIDVPAHIDFPGSFANPPRDELHGLNIHLTLSGVGQAMFGLLREFRSAVTLAEGIKQARENGLSPQEINQYFATAATHDSADSRIPAALQEGVGHMERAMQEASEPVTLNPGDIVIFQARQHQERQLLPTVHKFDTLEDPRWYTVFTPRGAPATEISNERVELVLDYLKSLDPKSLDLKTLGGKLQDSIEKYPIK